jgi:hypothetical protein
MQRNNHSARPKLACEIAPDRVIAGRASDSRQVLELCSTSELTPGCVVPDLTENNVRQRDMVVNALRRDLGVGPVPLRLDFRGRANPFDKDRR